MKKPHKGPPRFLFLEFLDSNINGLLHGLRYEFIGENIDTGIHITIRGPYEEQIPGDEILKYQQALDEEPILIQGVGVFHNPKEIVVYTKISSPQLRQIWWKPDYPTKKFGYNPHISLYKGSDVGLAKKIHDFLLNEKLTLVCHNFRLTPYVSKQGELFPFEEVPKERHFLRLSNRRIVRPDILQRAHNVVLNHRKGVHTDAVE